MSDRQIRPTTTPSIPAPEGLRQWLVAIAALPLYWCCQPAFRAMGWFEGQSNKSDLPSLLICLTSYCSLKLSCSSNIQATLICKLALQPKPIQMLNNTRKRDVLRLGAHCIRCSLARDVAPIVFGVTACCSSTLHHPQKHYQTTNHHNTMHPSQVKAAHCTSTMRIATQHSLTNLSQRRDFIGAHNSTTQHQTSPCNSSRLISLSSWAAKYRSALRTSTRSLPLPANPTSILHCATSANGCINLKHST